MEPNPGKNLGTNYIGEFVFDLNDPAVQEEMKQPMPPRQYAPQCRRDLGLEEFVKRQARANGQGDHEGEPGPGPDEPPDGKPA